MFWKSVASDNLCRHGKYYRLALYFETWGCFPKIWRWEGKQLFSFTFIYFYADLNCKSLGRDISRKQKEIPRETTLLKHQHILLHL